MKALGDLRQVDEPRPADADAESDWDWGTEDKGPRNCGTEDEGPASM